MAVHKTLETSIEFLKGVGPTRAALLTSELGVKTFYDLLWELPFRYVDKSVITPIKDINAYSDSVQIKGILERLVVKGEGRKSRLHGIIRDGSGFIELVWFKGVKWIKASLQVGQSYIVFGRVTSFGKQFNIPHPEVELASNASENKGLEPVYHSTEKLTKKNIEHKQRRIMMRNLLSKLQPSDLPEIIPSDILSSLRLPSRCEAINEIHFPSSSLKLAWTSARIKFEEFFLMQLRLLRMKIKRTEQFKGFVFKKVGENFNTFFKNHLPFELTNAQKRVIREIRHDLGSGRQMNRLLQGDVGSGKTIVAFLCMLLVINGEAQAAMMAPTEILAIQHYNGLKPLDQFGTSADNPEYATPEGALPWTTYNIYANYSLEKVTIQFAIENILDKHYTPFASGVSGPGINFILGFRGKF